MQINRENCFKFIDTGTLLKTFMVIITVPASINFTTCKLDHLAATSSFMRRDVNHVLGYFD